ncbi:hypothetical protein [Pedobacter psychrodurus]|uniref:hypothetical protein n=1 Tax=Pedobacter psychrodurus TaxID=2530456 RepID=UPI00292DDF73|nr:hypothetical protein [Pedobacter psychrodurus]
MKFRIYLKYILLLLISLIWTDITIAQSWGNDDKEIEVKIRPDTLRSILGSIKGRVKDSTYKYVLSSATVSVYKNIDSSLLKFVLPNNFGEFSIGKLPLNIPLKLIITHVRYTPYKKIFNLHADKSTIDFDWIYMFQSSDQSNNLEDVNITAQAPVRMNGDTLEFNPKAFKLDVNATTEDLIRVLPGMVVWGDGDITYNGKKINSLLVDGKPFMGGDFTAATQNLPKEVLDKVQIYSRRNEKNPLDSTLNANLKLKDDKKNGYFGKLSAGYGTKDRFAADGMLGVYNKKLQINTVGASNNVNRTADDINTLIRFNSFKGDGNNMDYQPDFKRAGINFSTVAATRLQYDFIPELSDRKSRRLTVDYFFKNNNETIENTILNNIILKTDSILSNHNTSQNKNIGTSNNISVNYAHQDKSFDLTISGDAIIGQANNTGQNIGVQTRTGTIGQLGNNKSLISSQDLYRKIVFSAQFNYQKEHLDIDGKKKRKKNLLDNFSLGYGLAYDAHRNELNNRSSILSAVDPGADKFFDRQYDRESISMSHTFNITYPNLRKLLFGFGNLAGIKMNLSGTLAFNKNEINDLVSDLVTSSQQRETNLNLTNIRNERVQNLQPELNFSKNFYNGLTNRYNKSLDISVSAKVQYYGWQSLAAQRQQNLGYQYHNFIPNSSISYNNHQYGRFEIKSALNFNTYVNYPSVDHLAPLVDSANVWYIPKGNLAVKPEYIKSFAWKTSLESRKSKNPYQIDFSLDGNFSDNKISDSVFYDIIGRMINYKVNIKGNKYWHMGTYFRKSYSPNKNNTYRFNIWYNHYSYHTPLYLDANLISSNNQNNNFDVELSYSFLDIVNINVKEGLSLYKNVQTLNDSHYNGQNNYTRFSGSLQLPKNLTWSTNVDLNTNKAENQSTVNYTIWNASLTYRFMRGENFEIKLSALDLLKQNKNVVNSTNRNVQTFGFNNVLQQCFMFGLAYYPRKFGK